MANFKAKETKNRTRKQRPYDVDITRTGYANMTIRVTASSGREAKELAIDEAGNHVFSEHDADYTAGCAIPVNED